MRSKFLAFDLAAFVQSRRWIEQLTMAVKVKMRERVPSEVDGYTLSVSYSPQGCYEAVKIRRIH